MIIHKLDVSKSIEGHLMPVCGDDIYFTYGHYFAYENKQVTNVHLVDCKKCLKLMMKMRMEQPYII